MAGAAVGVVLAGPLWAGPDGVEDQGEVPVTIEFEKYRLDNGIEVILHRDTTVPLVAVDVWYHVGSRDERPGQSGFAHLYEHMFKNSAHLGDRHHYQILREAGAASANASTSYDRTTYYEVLPSNQLELGLWIESDRMGYFLPGLDEQRFRAQVDVVRNERRQRYDNAPYGRERLAAAAALYPEDHPMRHLVIGRHEDIAAATLDMVTDFYKTWYVPSNATLCIAGDFDTEQARALVDKWFGTMPAAPRPARKPLPVVNLEQTVRVEVEDPLVTLRRLRYVWHSPAAMAAGDAELDVLAHALARVGTGRLYRALVHDRQLAQRVRVSQSGYAETGQFVVLVDLLPDAGLAEVERLIEAELAAVRDRGVTEREIARVASARESGIIWSLHRLLSRAQRLQYYNAITGDPGHLQADLDRFRAVTPASVAAAAARWLPAGRRVEVITRPAPTPG